MLRVFPADFEDCNPLSQFFLFLTRRFLFSQHLCSSLLYLYLCYNICFISYVFLLNIFLSELLHRFVAYSYLIGWNCIFDVFLLNVFLSEILQRFVVYCYLIGWNCKFNENAYALPFVDVFPLFLTCIVLKAQPPMSVLRDMD